MTRTLFFALLLTGLTTVFAEAETFNVSMQQRVPAKWNKTKLSLVNRVEEWKPEETAIIVCDMWDQHWCKHSTARFTELAAALEPVLKAARDKGVSIVHAPSETMKFYADFPQRKEAIKYTDTAQPTGWERNLPAEKGQKFPIEPGSNGGCEDSPKCKITANWTRQSELLTIAGNDIISDSRQEIAGYFKAKGIKNVILTGVATNMCVIGRPFGLRAMKQLGMNVVLMRDMTDTMFNSEKPQCAHHSGNDLMVAYIETYVCPSIVSSIFTGKKQYRFSDDKRKRIAFVTAEGEYRSDQRLPEFAHELTLQNYHCGFAIGLPKTDGEGRHNIENLQILDDADLMVLSVRRRALPPEQMTQIKKYIAGGKPVFAIRTSCVAFNPGKDLDGLERWAEFDKDVLGGNYHGYDEELRKQNTGTDVSVVSGKEEHPLLQNVQPFHCADWMYRQTPLRSDKAEVLLRGKNPKQDEPVFWLNGDKVIYTALGHWDDWELEPFRNLMFNSVKFLLKEQ
ncbi:MAG: isochorismatase family protein [Planctomycetaceae bacterium]|nr:isochorismatase family protein [Planctomycetaceae bacterium]